MWRDGRLLVARKGEEFPDRCVKSNRPAHGRRVQQAAEVGHAALLLAHLWSSIVGAAIAASVTKGVTFTVGLSNEWWRKRRRALCLAGGIIALSLAATAYGAALIGQNDLGLWLVPLGILSTLGGLLYGLNASTLVTATRITNRYFWLKGVHPDFLANLPEWPGEVWADLTSSSDPGE